MPGLLDFIQENPALLQGLLSAGFGAMAGRGTRMQAIGQGGLAGLLGYNSAINQQQENARDAQRTKFTDMQMKQIQGEIDSQAVARQQQEAVRAAAQGSVSPTGFDNDAFLQRLRVGGYPLAAVEYQQKLAPDYKVVGNNLVSVGKDGKVGEAYKGEPELPSGMRLGANGQPEWIPGYLEGKASTARAGASNVSVKVDNQMGKSVAEQIGPMVKATQEGAVGALNQADAADRVIKAVNSGNVITGPGASFRVLGAQIGQALGVGGKNAAEQLTNTREVVRGLAEFSLNARKSLAGQGQITENEQKLLDRAVSGDIDNLTGPEITQIANITRRQAERVHKSHQQNVKRLRERDSTSGIADFYEVPAFPAAPAGGAPASAPGAVRRYNPATGRIE